MTDQEPDSPTKAANGPHQGQPVSTAGASLDKARAAMVLLHGRGARASDILEIAGLLGLEGVAYLAPQAAGNTWYPYTFLAPIEHNEPSLSSALRVVADLVALIEKAGVPSERIILGGFSQGACLASEFAARNARRYGGLLVFSGGVIGPPGMERNYAGTMGGMPALIGCSDVDAHIPLERVQETEKVFQALGADVSLHIYPNMGHTINQDEIDRAKIIVQGVVD
ncbi:MAG: alpha/beta hydrolase [Caldilineaceae bacterium]